MKNMLQESCLVKHISYYFINFKICVLPLRCQLTQKMYDEPKSSKCVSRRNDEGKCVGDSKHYTPKAVITDLDSKFSAAVLKLTFHNFQLDTFRNIFNVLLFYTHIFN